nr:Ribonuclease H [Ipomoea batatas]
MLMNSGILDNTVVFEKLGCIRRVIGGGAVQVVVRNWHKKREVEVAWEKPEVGWTKHNFDGSCKWKIGKSSTGGVFRNHEANSCWDTRNPSGCKSCNKI